MKRWCAAFLMLVLVLVMCAGALADTEYALQLPANLEEIGDQAFYNTKGLDVVVLEEGVKSIGAQAFAYSEINEINLPESIEYIAEDAFDHTNLMEIKAFGGTYAYEWAERHGYHVTDLTSSEDDFYYEIVDGECVIMGYYKEGDMTIPAEIGGYPVTEIGDGAFQGDYFIKNVVLPETVTRIGADAFNGAYNMVSINIPSGVVEIGERAFRGCSGLECEIIVPEGVTRIAAGTFENCTAFSIELRGAVTEIGDRAFADNYRLEWFELPESVETIGAGAFESCLYLGGVDLPDGLISIGEAAFRYCVTLEEIVIPASVTDIEGDIFEGCGSQLTVRAAEGTYGYEWAEQYGYIRFGEDGFVFAEIEGGVELSSYTGSSREIAIPAQANGLPVIAIRENALRGMDLTSVVLPETLRTIGANAFGSCWGLRSIVIPEGVETIGEGAFQQCMSLKSIAFPASVKSIGAGAFTYCFELESVSLPTGLTAIPDSMFFQCERLSEIDLPDGLKSIGAAAFEYCAALKSIELPDGLREIGEWAFSGCSALGELAIPAGVSSISGSAFRNCAALSSVRLPEGLVSIDRYAFSECGSLKTIELPASISYIDDYAFYNTRFDVVTAEEGSYAYAWAQDNGYVAGAEVTEADFEYEIDENGECTITKYVGSVKYVAVPASIGGAPVAAIGESAFYQTQVISVEIPEGVRRIDYSAFAFCWNLENLVLPEGLTEIGDVAIYSCHNLRALTLPESLVVLGNMGIAYCDGLRSINLPAALESIGEYPFDDIPLEAVYAVEGTYAYEWAVNHGYNVIAREA